MHILQLVVSDNMLEKSIENELVNYIKLSLFLHLKNIERTKLSHKIKKYTKLVIIFTRN